MFAKIKTRVLLTLISLSLGALLLLSAVCLYGVFNMRGNMNRGIETLGETIASRSADALIKAVQHEIQTAAVDKAAVIDEKFMAIERQTRAVADMASRIYENPGDYAPRGIEYLHSGQEGTLIPHIRTAPGVDWAEVRDEVRLLANVQDVLRGIGVADIGVNASYIGGESGYFITADMNAAGPENRNYDVTERPWYIGAKESGALYWSDVFLDSSGRGLSLSCSMPFYSVQNGVRTLKGVAGSGARLDAIGEVIHTTDLDGGGYAFLMNQKGEVIISPKLGDYTTDESGNLLLENYRESGEAYERGLAAKMTGGQNGVMQLKLEGEDVYVGYAPLSGNGWSVGVVVPRSSVLAPVEGMQQDILSMHAETERVLNDDIRIIIFLLISCAVITILVTGGLSLRFANRITDPIIRLNHGVKEVSEGNLDAEIAVESRDEIGQLALAFNAMTLRLKEQMEHLSAVTAERERIATELNVATKIQASMLPSIFPPFPDRREFDLYAEMHPAREVGGDFYDFFLVDENHLGAVVADVSGKGVPAALFMVIAKTLLRNQLQLGGTPDEVFFTVNNQLASNNDTAMFVTAFMGVLEIDTGVFNYVNAGHPAPAIRRGRNGFAWLETDPGFILGGLEDIGFTAKSTRLAAGDAIFFYTDGVSEANDVAGEMFGEQRILDALNAPARDGGSAFDCVARVGESVGLFADGAEQADDVTIFALLYKGETRVKTLTVAADTKVLDEVIAFLDARLAEAGFAADERPGVQLALEEVFVNVARYAYPQGGGDAVITCVCGERRIVVTVEDEGVPFNPLSREDPDIELPAEKRGIGGLGVYMTKGLMDDVRYDFRDGKNVLMMVKNAGGSRT